MVAFFFCFVICEINNNSIYTFVVNNPQAAMMTPSTLYTSSAITNCSSCHENVPRLCGLEAAHY